MTDIAIHMILDKSGSMDHLQSSVISGYNEYIKSQKKLPGTCTFGLTMFDTQLDLKITGKDIGDVPDLDRNSYQPDGGTALYDAIGLTIKAVESLPKADKTLIVIYTDGEENSSREFTHAAITKLIDEKKADGWEFAYLGANQDAFAVGASMSIPSSSTMTWSPTAGGTAAAFNSVSTSTSNYRSGKTATYVAGDDDDD